MGYVEVCFVARENKDTGVDEKRPVNKRQRDERVAEQHGKTRLR